MSRSGLPENGLLPSIEEPMTLWKREGLGFRIMQQVLLEVVFQQLREVFRRFGLKHRNRSQKDHMLRCITASSAVLY